MSKATYCFFCGGHYEPEGGCQANRPGKPKAEAPAAPSDYSRPHWLKIQAEKAVKLAAAAKGERAVRIAEEDQRSAEGMEKLGYPPEVFLGHSYRLAILEAATWLRKAELLHRLLVERGAVAEAAREVRP